MSPRSGSRRAVRRVGARFACGRSAFTLIELLVVIAIIVLLMSILLPSLGAAREEAKTVKCISNLRQIGTAMGQYFQEHGDWFPFEKRNTVSPGLWNVIHGFYYGGHPGRQLPGNPGEWWGYTETDFRDTPGGRPFNEYLYPGLPTWDVPPTDPVYESVRNLPVYECPSDTGGFWAEAGEVPAGMRSCYWMSGTSYDANWMLAQNWAFGQFSGEQPRRWLQRANAFLRVQLRRYPSLFVVLYEDPFDSAMWNHLPRRGWHRKWNRHSFLYLDTHAANIVADTGRDTSGPGWKCCAGSRSDPWAFWNRTNDPDYQYRDIMPLPGN